MLTDIAYAFLNIISSIFSNHFVCFIIMTLSLVIKLFFLSYVLPERHKVIKNDCALLNMVSLLLMSALVTDSAWMVKILSLLLSDYFQYRFVICYIRIAWIAFIVQYQVMGMIVYYLKTKKNLIHDKPYFSNTAIAFIVFIGIIGIVNCNISSPFNRWWGEPILQKIVIVWFVCVMLPRLAFLSFEPHIPLIIQKQLDFFFKFYIMPQSISDLIHINPMNLGIDFITESYAFSSLSAILLNFIIIFCVHTIMRLRFLNFKKNIDSPAIDQQFKERLQVTLSELSSVSDFSEMSAQIRYIMTYLFQIPHEYITINIHIEDGLLMKNNVLSVESKPQEIKSLIHKYPSLYAHFLEEKILSRHEIEFAIFFDEKHPKKQLLALLDELKTNLIIPIFYQKEVLGYISVRDASDCTYTLLTGVQKNAAIIIASYLGTFLQILQSSKLITTQSMFRVSTQYIHELENRLELSREGIIQLINQFQLDDVGLFIYHKRRLEPIKKNSFSMYANNPVVLHACHLLFTKNEKVESEYQKTIVIDRKNVIVSVIAHRPKMLISIEFETIIHKMNQIEFDSDAILKQGLINFYLCTTQIGNALHELLPGNIIVIKDARITLFQAIIGIKSLLLYGHKRDLDQAVFVIHSLSKKTIYKVLDAKNYSIESLASLLFGLEMAYVYPVSNERQIEAAASGLLSVCNEGILVIHNANNLPPLIQKQLVAFIETGFYTPYRGFSVKQSNARVILTCSYEDVMIENSNSILMQLNNVMSIQVLHLPRVDLLSNEKKASMIIDFLRAHALWHTITKERERIIIQRVFNKNPTGLFDYKNIVYECMRESGEDIHLHKTSVIAMPIQSIVANGKNVLKNKDMLAVLWHTFDRNQAYIASLLNVHRSSVNRRIKEFNL